MQSTGICKIFFSFLLCLSSLNGSLQMIHDQKLLFFNNIQNNQILENMFSKEGIDDSLSWDQLKKDWTEALGLNLTEYFINKNVTILNKKNIHFYPFVSPSFKLYLLSIKGIDCIDLSKGTNLSTLPIYDFCYVFPDLTKVIVDISLVDNIINNTSITNTIVNSTNNKEDNLLALVGWRSSHNPTGNPFPTAPPGFREQRMSTLQPILITTKNGNSEDLYKINSLYAVAYSTFFQIPYFKYINCLLFAGTSGTFLLNIFLRSFFIPPPAPLAISSFLAWSIIPLGTVNALLIEPDIKNIYVSITLWLLSRMIFITPLMLKLYYNSFDNLLTDLHFFANIVLYVYSENINLDMLLIKIGLQRIINGSFIPA